MGYKLHSESPRFFERKSRKVELTTRQWHVIQFLKIMGGTCVYYSSKITEKRIPFDMTPNKSNWKQWLPGIRFVDLKTLYMSDLLKSQSTFKILDSVSCPGILQLKEVKLVQEKSNWISINRMPMRQWENPRHRENELFIEPSKPKYRLCVNVTGSCKRERFLIESENDL